MFTHLQWASVGVLVGGVLQTSVTSCYQEILVHYVGQVRVGYEETKKKGYEGEPTWALRGVSGYTSPLQTPLFPYLVRRLKKSLPARDGRHACPN